MKKIGLAVCYDTKNFGSQLQVLATVKKIECLGYRTEIIRYKKILTPKFIIQTIPRLFNVSFVISKLKENERDKKASKHPEIMMNINNRNKRFNEFINAYFGNLSNVYTGWETLVKECDANYDAFLCGSDQLWLPNNLGSHFYTLEFVSDYKPKIAYATSFGVSEIPFFQKKRTAKYLRRFSSLSTREITGAKIIADLTGINAEVVCDPTMLLTADEWLDIIPDKEVIKKPYIFCYFLGSDESHREEALKLKKLIGYDIITIPFLDNFVERDIDFGDINLYDVDASDFINLIRHAEYILTDSFHGTVFSIIYKKKFLTFNRFSEGLNSRNSRIDSLCGLLCLEDRRFNKNIEIVRNEINYDVVTEQLAKLRDKSLEFLIGSLKKIDLE